MISIVFIWTTRMMFHWPHQWDSNAHLSVHTRSKITATTATNRRERASSVTDIQRRVILLFAVYLFFAIWRRNDHALVRVKDPYTGEVTVEKHWEYDLGKLRELMMTKIGISAALSALIASRYGMPFPLLLQSLNNPKAVYYSELFEIYVLGRREEGRLVRPWTESSMIPEWMASMWNQGEKDAAKITGTNRPSKS